MLLLLLLPVFAAVQQDVPYKPEQEFSIKLDLKFMMRSASSDRSTVNFTESQAEYQKRTSSQLLPHLTLILTIHEVNQGESRMKIFKDGKVLMGNKKIETDKEFKLTVGFTDDAKDKISGYEHVIYFLTANKKEVNRIVITIEENGDYIVNGQKLGRL
jgi:hypothetical protein